LFSLLARLTVMASLFYATKVKSTSRFCHILDRLSHHNCEVFKHNRLSVKKKCVPLHGKKVSTLATDDISRKGKK
jgi:hypothetical protein